MKNGATLCGKHHWEAEATTLSVETIREAIGAKDICLPPQFYRDEKYDKWGNPILPSGQRVKGELFFDESVQKVLEPVLHLFINRFKYPRTWHLPNSPGVGKGDRVLSQGVIEEWVGTEVVVTEKMDGENTTIYTDYVHARSIDYAPRIDRDRIKALHAKIGWSLPLSWRICGENLTAKHSIKYEKLPSFFLVFGMWINQICFSWDDTELYASILGLKMVPVLWRGKFTIPFLDATKEKEYREGFVIRPAGSFLYNDYSKKVGKWVRADHVKTQAHWTRRIEFNDFLLE